MKRKTTKLWNFSLNYARKKRKQNQSFYYFINWNHFFNSDSLTRVVMNRGFLFVELSLRKSAFAETFSLDVDVLAIGLEVLKLLTVCFGSSMNISLTKTAPGDWGVLSWPTCEQLKLAQDLVFNFLFSCERSAFDELSSVSDIDLWSTDKNRVNSIFRRKRWMEEDFFNFILDSFAFSCGLVIVEDIGKNVADVLTIDVGYSDAFEG